MGEGYHFINENTTGWKYVSTKNDNFLLLKLATYSTTKESNCMHVHHWNSIHFGENASSALPLEVAHCEVGVGLPLGTPGSPSGSLGTKRCRPKAREAVEKRASEAPPGLGQHGAGRGPGVLAGSILEIHSFIQNTLYSKVLHSALQKTQGAP